MAGAEGDPAALVILQPVAWAFHFNHPVASFPRPELDQIRHARTVGAYVAQQPFKPPVQMLGGQAEQSQIEYFLAEPPVNKGRLDAELAGVVCPDYLLVAARLQVPEALVEQVGAALAKVAAVQVYRSVMERMEEGARHRSKDRFPAEQSEQAADQRVLHVVHGCLGSGEVLAHGPFNRPMVRAGQFQLDSAGGVLCGYALPR